MRECVRSFVCALVDARRYVALNNCLRGAVHTPAKRSLDKTRKTVGAHDPQADRLKKLASAGSKLAYLAAGVRSVGALVGWCARWPWGV